MIVPPALFIPVAEETRLINQLGAFVLREACRAVRDLAGLPVAVNLCPIQLLDERLVEGIQGILAETGLPPTRLEVEITEGYLIQQPDRAAEVLRRLRALGIKVSLDEFGAGFASLGYLRRFRLDKIKLDRSFIQSIAVDAQARRITNAVVELGRALDIRSPPRALRPRSRRGRSAPLAVSCSRAFSTAGRCSPTNWRRSSAPAARLGCRRRASA